MSINVFTFVFVLTTFILLGATTSPHASAQPKIHKDAWNELNTNHGLSQNSVNAITQDSLGRIWMATQDGINRYDSLGFKVFYGIPADRYKGLTDQEIMDIEHSDSDMIYAVTASGSLLVYDLKKDKFSTVITQEKNIKQIEKIDNDILVAFSESMFWVVKGKQIITTFTPKYNEPTRLFSNISPNKFITISNSGLAFIGTYNQVENHIQWDDELPQQFPNSSVSVSTNNDLLIIAANGEIFSLTQQKLLAKLDISAKTTPTSATFSPFNKVWIGTTGGGLFAFDPNTLKINKYTKADGIPDNYILSAFTCAAGNLWIGTWSNGAAYLPANIIKFHHTTPQDIELESADVMALAETDSGDLWVGTLGAGIVIKQSDGKIRKLNLDTGFKSDYILSLFQYDKNTMYVGTLKDGAIAVDINTGKIINHLTKDNVLLSNKIHGFAKSGSILLLANRPTDNAPGGIVAVNLKDNSKIYEKEFDQPWHFLKAGSQKFYFGTDTGLYTLDLISKQTAKIFPNNNTKQRVWTIAKQEQSLLLGTKNGLVQLDLNSGEHKRYTTIDGLANNTIYSIQTDNSGNAWITTNRGISRLNFASSSIANYTPFHGLQSYEFNLNSSLKTAGDKIAFGGINGINTFDPFKIISIKSTPRAHIRELRVFDKVITPHLDGKAKSLIDKTIEFTDAVTLESDQNTISVELASANFCTNNPAKYRFKLEGFDTGWIYAGNRNYAAYTNLDPGEYTFLYQAAASDIAWPQKFKTLKITVKAPFYQTGVFYFILSTFITIFLSTVFLYYRKLYREVNQKIQAQKDLAISESNSRALFDSANDAIIIHNSDTGKMEAVNQTAIEMYGYSSKEDLINEDVAKLTSNCEKYNNDAAFEKISQAKIDEPLVFDWLCIKSDGTEFWAEVNLKKIMLPEGPKIMALVRDIDDRKRAQQENKNLREYLANVINSMPSAIIGVNVDHIITHWNIHAAEMAEITNEPLVGKNCIDAFPLLAEFETQIQNSIKTHEATPALHFVHDEQSGDNHSKPKHFDVMIYPLTSEEFKGAVIRIDDVTEKVYMEEMMIQSEKMLSLGGLVAGVAHEINNPLAGMMQTANAILNRIKSENQANKMAAENAGVSLDAIRKFLTERRIIGQLETLHEAGIKTSSIVRSMLSFARKSALEFSNNDPCLMMDESIELFRQGMDLKLGVDYKHIKIERYYADDIPAISCDATKIKQVLFNLLKNGADAMYEIKQVRGSDYVPQFDIRISSKGSGLVEIVVTDNGPGIPFDMQKHIFEPFFTTKNTGKGTGLGLSISYFIVTQNHSGNMKIHSEEGKGTSFIITLPIKQKPQEKSSESGIETDQEKDI